MKTLKSHRILTSFTRSLLIGCISVLSVFSCFAQGWEAILPNDLSTDYMDQAYALSDGSVLVYGSRRQSNTSRGAILYKLNPYGETSWELYLDMSGPAVSFSEIIDCGDGTFVVSYLVFPDPPGNVPTYLIFVKFDSDGNLIWEYDLFPNTEHVAQLRRMIPAPDGGIFFSAIHFGNGLSTEQFVGKLNCDGTLDYLKEIDDQVYTIQTIQESNNKLYLIGIETFPISTGELYISEVDNLGNIIATRNYPGINDQRRPFIDSNEDIIFFREEDDDTIYTQHRVNTNNVVVSIDTIYNGPAVNIGSNRPVDGGFLLVGNQQAVPPAQYQAGIAIKIDLNGNSMWTKTYNNRPGNVNFRNGFDAIDDGFVLVGQIDSDGYVVKIDANGNIYTNVISGVVSQDLDDDCAQSAGDIPIQNWLITAEKSGDQFIASSDADGNYFLPVDTGNYVVTLHTPNDYWGPCANDSMVNLVDFDNQILIDYSVTNLVDCPFMYVDGSTPFLRPCFENNSFFSWCNNGTTLAESASIEITFDSLITPISSDPAWTSQNENTYTFELGDLEPLTCGSISMVLFLDCNAPVGDSYCIEAHAMPDSLCGPVSPQWSGAFLEVTGVCDDEEVLFRIRNTGNGDMDIPSNYIIVEDAVLRSTNTIELGSGTFQDFPLNANGSTYTLMADQVMDAPGNSMPIAVLEGCGENGDGTYSTGFSNQFGLNDGDPFYDIDCIVATLSYDPNEKNAYPVGYQEEHYIAPRTPLEYQILFQNTGTDTAFTVVLRDTLDEWLDVTTFQAGASSHAYIMEFTDRRTLKFTFDNIHLPDSATNQLGSNGFVSFKISPHADTPLETVIRNKAAIYFDFNDPIITNETFHTIGENFIDIITNVIHHPTGDPVQITVQPNPFSDYTLFHIHHHESGEYTFELFDTQGRKLRQESHTSNQIGFYKKDLTAGLYYYRIIAKDGPIGSGSLMVR